MYLGDVPFHMAILNHSQFTALFSWCLSFFFWLRLLWYLAVAAVVSRTVKKHFSIAADGIPATLSFEIKML